MPNDLYLCFASLLGSWKACRITNWISIDHWFHNIKREKIWSWFEILIPLLIHNFVSRFDIKVILYCEINFMIWIAISISDLSIMSLKSIEKKSVLLNIFVVYSLKLLLFKPIVLTIFNSPPHYHSFQFLRLNSLSIVYNNHQI